MILASLLLPRAAGAADRYFATSDGVRLHYIEAGPNFAPTLVFVPGWTMPAWIFQRQIDAFSRDYHVIAFDPRGQGDSDIPATGYEPYRRGADIADLIKALGNRQVVLVGWSLGVLDSLAYVHEAGDGKLLGLVLLDNSVGEDPAPVYHPRPPGPRPPRVGREATMARFVRSMFHRPQDETYLDQLTETALRTPPNAAASLLSYPVPRTYWRDAIYTVRKPILYIVTPRLAAQAENLQARHTNVRTDVYSDSGHALFIDDGNRFNTELLDFLRTAVLHQ
ncbi:alpha/beta fold hydrolase [Acidisphaera sp. L21]|uniref:alpha/beta fold hydrolase n=1 Tax=Acidisphaera sp. L21 TaxID=1641851 RepID=UPI00131BDBEB|nr:alpha/beta hydrolase [Acidisphaera sp. L21]